mmetsp:Transcript_29623/g.70609  ORF Transcript_29623/g.70609 Transcript_29623/m.70609 type:complete len:282 (+) Transcript_29623:200-1045(+)
MRKQTNRARGPPLSTANSLAPLRSASNSGTSQSAASPRRMCRTGMLPREIPVADCLARPKERQASGSGAPPAIPSNSLSLRELGSKRRLLPMPRPQLLRCSESALEAFPLARKGLAREMRKAVSGGAREATQPRGAQQQQQQRHRRRAAKDRNFAGRRHPRPQITPEPKLQAVSKAVPEAEAAGRPAAGPGALRRPLSLREPRSRRRGLLPLILEARQPRNTSGHPSPRRSTRLPLTTWQTRSSLRPTSSGSRPRWQRSPRVQAADPKTPRTASSLRGGSM